MVDRLENEQELQDLLRRNPHLSVEGQSLTKQAETTRILDTHTPADLNAHFGKEEISGLTWQQWQDRVLNHLRENGWLARIIRPARSEKGWRTPIQGDVGEPDVFAVHPGKLITWWIECKTGRGALSPKQEKWVMALTRCQAVNPQHTRMDILRPEDWEDFKRRTEE